MAYTKLKSCPSSLLRGILDYVLCVFDIDASQHDLYYYIMSYFCLSFYPI